MADEIKVDKEATYKSRKNAIEIVRLRNNYYRDSYRFFNGCRIGFGGIVCADDGDSFYLYTTRPAPRYFATNIMGGLTEIQPLTSPSLSDAALLGWSARAATSAFTFNYVQYQQQLEETKNTYFTPDGGQNLLDAIKASLNLQTVTQGLFVVTAEIAQAPIILKRGIMTRADGVNIFAWEIKVPIRVQWRSASRNFGNMYNVMLTVVRTSVLIDPVARQMNLDSLQGVAVQQFVAQTLS